MKLKKLPDCVDYSDLIDKIEKKHNINTRDYAGMFSKEERERQKNLWNAWLIENGYDPNDPCLDMISPGKDWEIDSPEMLRRIEINSKFREVEREVYGEELPYLDYWHRICDDVNRGGINYLDLYDEEPDLELPEKYQNWVNEIHHMIIEEVKDSPAYDPDEMVLTFYVDW